MTLSNSMNKNRLGFLTIVSDPAEARIGGLLLVNASGRPLEFHCTAPVKPNRAQEILYGPTLGDYLCGEQIGMALCDALKHPPSLMLTDISEVLSLRPLVDFPVVLVIRGDDHSAKLADELVRVDRGTSAFAVRRQQEEDLCTAEAILQATAPSLDLGEPFGRIHEAISEAQGGIRKQNVA